MSPTLEDRIQAWKIWIAANIDYKTGWSIVGYEHQCGSMNALIISGWDEADFGDIYCSGCRYLIKSPDTECKPLYRKEMK